MLKLVPFSQEHIPAALAIARSRYEAERQYTPWLPHIGDFPDLRPFAQNGLGVAALHGESLMGYLCGVPPFRHAFGSTDAVGVFSPIHANGAAGEHRGEVYARMVQAAAEKWARAGAASHAVCLYAHDHEGQSQLFRYGYGLRCMDATRPAVPLNAPPCPGYTFRELAAEELLLAYPLELELDRHMAQSPTFILRPSQSPQEFLQAARQEHSRIFAAFFGSQAVAYYKITERSGETFLTDYPQTQHIHGAFCLPEHRGKGVAASLLDYVLQVLQGEGIQNLGVDFESINPSADRFWHKHFAVYTHSVTRRADEHAVAALHSSSL